MQPNQQPKYNTNHTAGANSPNPYVMLNAALAYAKMGIPVFPLHNVNPRGKCTCGNPTCGNPGKHPRTANGLKNATTNELIVRQWWKQWPNANIGGRAGVKFVVLDPDGGDEAFAEAAEYGVDLEAFHSITGDGRHYLFALPEGVTLRNKVKDTGDWPLHHCDARAEGGYIVLPPSLHYSGRRYAFSEALDLATLLQVPEKLLAVWRDAPDDPRNRIALEADEPDELEDVETNDGDERGEVTAQYFVHKYTGHVLQHPEAGRNTIGFYLALQLRDNGISQQGAVQYMRQYQQAVQDLKSDPYTWDAAERSLDQAYSREARAPLPRTYEYTDVGNGHRFYDKFGTDYHYNVNAREWLHWNGTVWLPDSLERVQEDAKTISTDLFLAAGNITDGDKAKKARSFAAKSGNGSSVRNMINFARTEARIPIAQHQLDTDPMLLAFPNGYYNLLTDEFTPAKRSNLVSKVCAAPYIEDATHELWTWALNTFLPEPAQQQDFLAAMAYCLTARPKEHAFIGYGDSKSGKSTVVSMVMNALGNSRNNEKNGYSLGIDIESFAAGKYGDGAKAREDLVAMVGRRLVVASESNQGVRLNSAILKRITGNDPMSLRANYGRQFSVLPTFGMWILANHLPKLPADDGAVWERVHVFKFGQYIKPEDRDEAMRDRTIDPTITGSAVLASVLQAWRRLRDDLGGRIVLPTTVQETAQYRKAEDAVAQFIAECCTEEPSESCRASVFKAAFRKYLQREGVHEQYTDQRLGRALHARGIESFKSSGTWYQGVTVVKFYEDEEYGL